MGKPSKWFNKLLGRCRRRKTVPENTTAAADGGVPGNIDYYGGGNGGVEESNKHAIAVAAATAAVAEAAFAAAKAAAEVVRLTSNNVSRRRLFLDELAAVKIQSVFRGYLARRALKALKGLVKLQALVRGYFVRKQSADMLLRLQAMVRVQARARSSRALSIESSSHCSPAKVNQSKPGISEDSEHSSVLKRCGSNSSVRDTATSWLDNWVTEEKNAKLLEIADSYTPESNPRARNRNNRNSDDTASLKSVQCPSEKRAQFSGASRTGSMRIMSPKTPLRDEYTRSYYHNSYGSPSYMCNTQSSRAKSRSHSVPRYRVIEPEKLGSIKRSLHALWDSKTSSRRSSESFSNMAKQRW